MQLNIEEKYVDDYIENDDEEEYDIRVDRYEIDTILWGELSIHISNSAEDFAMGQMSIVLREDTVFAMDLGRSSIRIESNFIYDQEDIPEEFITDMNHNGYEDIVIRYHSGGAHCCNYMWIYENQDGSVKAIFRGPEKDMGSYIVEDIDEDGIAEIITRDDTFSYFDGGYAQSPSMIIVEKWQQGRYSPRLIKSNWYINEKMRSVNVDSILHRLPMDEANIYHDEFWCKTQDYMAPSELWHIVCQLIEIGECERVDGFVRRSWGSGVDVELNEAMEAFWKELKVSHYMDYYRANGCGRI